MNVLIAEDDFGMLESLAELLCAFGYQVAISRDGQEALSLAAGGIDVLVTDYRLPGMSGLDLQRLACETNPSLEVIVMTGHGSDEVRDQAFEMGARAYFEKPFHPHSLLAALRSIDDERVAKRRRPDGSGCEEDLDTRARGESHANDVVL